MFFVLCIVFGLNYFGPLRAKNVYIESKKLYIDNFFTKIEIPITEVKKVNEIKSSPGFAWLQLKNETKFGKLIIFLPRTGSWFFRPHPDLVKLGNLVNSTMKIELPE
jgi:hypothetical protein